MAYANWFAQVRKVIWNLFELLPTPEAAMEADAAPIRKLIEPLGLAPKRAPMLIRFSREYVEKQVWLSASISPAKTQKASITAAHVCPSVFILPALPFVILTVTLYSQPVEPGDRYL